MGDGWAWSRAGKVKKGRGVGQAGRGGVALRELSVDCSP